MRLKMNADLVTLSACSTAKGDTANDGLEMDSLGMVAQQQGDYVAAQQYYDECLALRRELGDPRAVIGVDRQHESVEKAATLARRPGEQRIHRWRQPDEAHMVAERARRGDARAVDSIAPLSRVPVGARFPAGAQLMSLAVLLDFD